MFHFCFTISISLLCEWKNPNYNYIPNKLYMIYELYIVLCIPTYTIVVPTAIAVSGLLVLLTVKAAKLKKTRFLFWLKRFFYFRENRLKAPQVLSIKPIPVECTLHIAYVWCRPYHYSILQIFTPNVQTIEYIFLQLYQTLFCLHLYVLEAI